MTDRGSTGWRPPEQTGMDSRVYFQPQGFETGFGLPPLSSSQVCLLLQMNLRVLAAQGACLLPSAALMLLDTGSSFANLRLHPNMSVTNAVAATYVCLLQHISENIVAEASACLKKEMEALCASLLQKRVCQEQSRNQVPADFYSESELVALLKFDISVLLSSAQPRRNDQASQQVEQRAKQIRGFILEKLDPFKPPLCWYSDLQASAFRALRRVCSWMLSKDSVDVISSFDECSRVMVEALVSDAGLVLKLECLEWLGESAEWLKNVTVRDNSPGLDEKLFQTLLTAASDREIGVREQVARCCELLLQANVLRPSQLHALAGVALERLGDPESGLRAAYGNLLAASGSAALWVRGWNLDSQNPHQQWKYVRHFAAHLRPQQVICMLNYVSQRPQVLPSGWLQRLICNCLRQPKAHDDKDFEATEVADAEALVRFASVERWCSSNDVAALWCLVQDVARHCIAVRFRTHLGGPTQTFAALERMLLEIPQLSEAAAGQRGGASGSQLLPMRLLLELVEDLQKNIYNAYEGSVLLSPPASASVLFFRANKKVCEEWFARIREALMNASSTISCHVGTAHHALLRLQDLRALAYREQSRTQAPEGAALRLKLQQDVFRVLRFCALALCRMHDCDAVAGLQAWAASAFGGLMVEDESHMHWVSNCLGSSGWLGGLVLQSRGEYEKAAAHFAELLQSEEAMTAIGADGVEFAVSRIIESYVALSDWEALEGWLQELQTLRAQHAGKPYAGALTTAGNDMNAIHALARFDAGDIEGSCGYLDLTPQSSSELIVDPRQALQRSEQMLIEAMLRRDDQKEAAKRIFLSKAMVEESLLTSVLDGVSEAAPYVIQRVCTDIVEASFEQPREIHKVLAQVTQHPLDEMYQDCHLWLKVLRVYKMAYPNLELVSQLHQQLFRLARKQSNFRLARRLLKQMETLEQLPEVIHYQTSLLLSSEGHGEKAIIELWPLVRSYITQSATLSEADMLKAKACLKLASWLRKKLPSAGLITEMQLESSGNSHLLLEEVIGAGKKAATRLHPMLGRAWFHYASWCYTQAKGSFFGNELISTPAVFPEVLNEEFVSNSCSLTDEELEVIRTVISKSTTEDLPIYSDPAAKEALVKRVVHVIETTASGAGFEEWDGDSPLILLTSQLHQELQVLTSSNLSNALTELVEVWWKLRRRRVALVGHAASGFLKYLSMSSRSDGARKKDFTLSASLVVLRILQNYGVELEEVIQLGLKSMPPAPWQEITPQLFACLSSHPEPRVRRQLEELLMVLAGAYPGAIIYPTLVDLGNQPCEELERILDSLLKLYPKLVHDVRLMIAELGSITFLWEEQWLTTLQDLQADVTRRLHTLKEEASRVAENHTLSHEEKLRINAAKYTAIMAPVVISLERRLALTSKLPETPHETWFQEHFGIQLKQAIAMFKVPPAGAHSLSDVWKRFESIAGALSTHHKRSAVLLSEVSPRLAALRNSDAPMPGLEAHAHESSSMVSVAGFEDQVTVLATKTKPKKVTVMGSDGRRYTYLLKGREDLRLDARIMQLLRASNKMLQSDKVTRRRGLAIRCYSVTPISGRAGLIQWVDNVTSLYSVYKAWQLRSQVAQLPANTATNGGPPIPRPSDMFYAKIIPTLKEKGSRKVISRRDWPLDVKRKVLLELMKETPRQLLYKELWCASSGLSGLSAKLNRFSASVAVMSMIGHILGLGDRHLDNILIDFSTGEVVHIDYNVCFDKGLRLKVPEIVPFRLTQTIHAALGPTGVEGAFRANCESVMSTLQKNKDLILMLLEAFIWDPLLEWIKGDGHDEATIGGEERKGMELAVSLSLFASHVQENRVAFQEHHDHLVSTLPVAATALQDWAYELENFEKSSAVAYRVAQKKFTAEKAEAAARALLTEASAVREKAHLAYELQAREFGQIKGLITEAAKDSAQWIDQRTRVIDALRSGTCAELKGIGQSLGSPEAVSLISAVICSGVPLSTIPEPAQVHCKDVDKEVVQWCTARNESLLHAAGTIQAYAVALQRLLPANYVNTSYVHSWAQLLQLLSSRQVSPEVLTLAKRQAIEILSRDRPEQDEAVWQKHEQLRQRAERVGEEMQTADAERVQLEASVSPDAEKKAKDKIMAIFIRNLQVGKKDDEEPTDIEERRSKVLSVLQSAAAVLYAEAGEEVAVIEALGKERVLGSMDELQCQTWCFSKLQDLIERCVLVSDVLNEVQQVTSKVTVSSSVLSDRARICKACLGFVDHLVKQMVGVVLPEAIKAALSHDPAVMEAFATLSQIRGAIDTTLEQVVEIELQKASLVDLDKSYPEKVAELTRRRAVIEAAAADGRDNLSWEEAEELASQEDVCREQLETLHAAWAQRGAQAAAVLRMEALVRANLAAAEQRFEALVALDREDLHLMRGKVLLAAFAKLFSGLESLDSGLKFGRLQLSKEAIQLDKLLSPGLEYLWQAPGILRERTFFVWKVCVMDVLLDSCIRDASNDLSLSLEQLVSQQKRRLQLQLQGLLDLYLRERVAPEFLDMLRKEMAVLNHDSGEELSEPVRKAVKLLREYCDVHESLQAARSASAMLKSQVDERRHSLQDTQLEIAQLEWLHESALQAKLKGNSAVSFLDNTSMAWWNRKQILDNVRNSIAAISRATEGLQKCEVASMTAEEQLERTMAWACAGASGGSSIPQEFHDHLRRRQQILWSGQEQATNIVRISVAVLEFEASRDGFLDSQAGSTDGRAWQQAYQKMISRLEAAYVTFTSCDLEWKSAQKTLEAASANLSIVLKEFNVISDESDKATRELKDVYAQLKQQTTKTAAAVSSFCRVMRTHTALTSEGVSMLDEVLALTEGSEAANEVHTLAKEAISERKRLMLDLKRVHGEVLSLEPQLTSASSVMNSELDTEAATRSGRLSMLQSLNSKLKESMVDLPSTVASVLSAVQKLHWALINLARAASADGSFHKALEGTEDSQSKTQESGTVPASKELLSAEAGVPALEPQLSGDIWEDDDSWISPPGSDSEDSDFGVLELSSTQSGNGVGHEEQATEESDGTEGFSLSEGRISQLRENKPEASQGSLLLDKPRSGEAQSGRQPSLKSAIHAPSFFQPSTMDHRSRVVRGNAVNVLKRVKAKLEGLDIDDTGQLSVAEQVDHLIRQATSIDNLCSMYEGWTPWI